MNILAILLRTVVIIVLFSSVVVVLANEPIRVGLIVIGTELQSACVELDAANPTGYDVLIESGLEVNALVGPLGVAICAINNMGCFAPAEECFCQCERGRCSYWAYYYRTPDDDEWVYSSRGASNRQVDNGYVELWVWRPYDRDESELPRMNWDDICAGATTTIDMERAQDDEAPLWAYVLFGMVAVTVITGVLWRRHR